MIKSETNSESSKEKAKTPWTKPVVSNIDIKQTLFNGGSGLDGGASHT